MSDQTMLFYTMPKMHVGDQPRSLLEIVRWLDSDQLLIPKFQREFIWDDVKIAGWYDTVITNTPIGVIVCYQIGGDGPIYLADGFQRLHATMRLIEDLHHFVPKSPFDREQFLRYVSACSMSLQHRHYASHEEALVQFQRLNQGTTATPFEYFKGELSLNKVGELVLKQAPDIVWNNEKRFLRGPRKSRSDDHKHARDAMALFYQYVTGTDEMSFDGVASATVSHRHKPIERKLIEFINDNSVSYTDMEAHLDRFNRFLDGFCAELSVIIIECGQNGKAMMPTLMRFFMHLYIWRKNTRRSGEMYWQLVRKMIEHIRNYPIMTSRFELPSDNDRDAPIIVALKLGSLRFLGDMCKAFDVPLYETKRRSKQTNVPASGFHESHVQPFSIHGDGETLLEPGPRNMIRGAKPISDDEL